MPSRPAVKTRPITRDKLASFLGSHELIKAFESLSDDVSATLPDAALANAMAAEVAQNAAVGAAAAAESANVAALNAQMAADAAAAAANDALAAPGVGSLLADIESLRARIAALEQGSTP